MVIFLTSCKTEYYSNYNENSIYIEKLNLKMNYEILSLYSDVSGIAMFEECGRPNVEGTNTIIGAHSGAREDAYFNDLHKLSIGDQIIVYYDNKEYLYIVKVINEVDDTEVNVLNNNGKSMLTLLTCKINDINKRVIVIADLVNGKI